LIWLINYPFIAFSKKQIYKMLYIKSNNIYCFMKKANTFRLPTSPSHGSELQRTTSALVAPCLAPPPTITVLMRLSARHPRQPHPNKLPVKFHFFLLSSPCPQQNPAMQQGFYAALCSLVGVLANQQPSFADCFAVTGEDFTSFSSRAGAPNNFTPVVGGDANHTA
jgi:hypothetical protein